MSTGRIITVDGGTTIQSRSGSRSEGPNEDGMKPIKTIAYFVALVVIGGAVGWLQFWFQRSWGLYEEILGGLGIIIVVPVLTAVTALAVWGFRERKTYVLASILCAIAVVSWRAWEWFGAWCLYVLELYPQRNLTYEVLTTIIDGLYMVFVMFAFTARAIAARLGVLAACLFVGMGSATFLIFLGYDNFDLAREPRAELFFVGQYSALFALVAVFRLTVPPLPAPLKTVVMTTREDVEAFAKYLQRRMISRAS